MSDPVIRVDNFSKSYGNELAVDNLSFTVNAGDILGLLGPNGAGKTTTLRTLAGIVPPSAGRLIVSGADVVQQPIEAKLKLAFIPDDPRLFDTLTVWEHLEFTAAAYRIGDFESSARNLLKQFELSAKSDTLAQELSRGMRQKLAIACGYLHEPTALLFDEPLTGLDPHSIEILQDSIRARARNGVAVLISSHLLTLVEDLCTHILILDKGIARFEGSIEDANKLVTTGDGSTRLHNLFFHLTRDQNINK